MAAIYKIFSKAYPELMYIGSAVDPDARWKVHISALKNKTHNKIIQEHTNKYGISDLQFEIVEEVSKDNLKKREQYYIDRIKPYFNIVNAVGLKTSKITRVKFNLGCNPGFAAQIKEQADIECSGNVSLYIKRALKFYTNYSVKEDYLPKIEEAAKKEKRTQRELIAMIIETYFDRVRYIKQFV